MNFESELSKGRFCIPRCADCEKIIWPPSEFCAHCFGDACLYSGDFAGRVIEFSRYKGRFFCMVEFEGIIRVMAEMLEMPEISQSVRISECGINEGRYFFKVV